MKYIVIWTLKSVKLIEISKGGKNVFVSHSSWVCFCGLCNQSHNWQIICVAELGKCNSFINNIHLYLSNLSKSLLKRYLFGLQFLLQSIACFCWSRIVGDKYCEHEQMLSLLYLILVAWFPQSLLPPVLGPDFVIVRSATKVCHF